MLSSEFRVNSLHEETTGAKVAFWFNRLYNEDRAARSIEQNDAKGLFILFLLPLPYQQDDGEVII